MNNLPIVQYCSESTTVFETLTFKPNSVAHFLTPPRFLV